MTGSALAHVLIVLAAAGGVAAMIGLVLLAARRPYFRHPRPDPTAGKVRGGMHLGDPRSLAPPEWERADIQGEPGQPEPTQADSTQAGSTQAGSTQAGSTQAGSTQAGSTQEDSSHAERGQAATAPGRGGARPGQAGAAARGS